MDTAPFRYHFQARDIKTSRNQVDAIGQGTYGRVFKVYTNRLGVSAAKIFHITGTTDRQNEIYRTVKNEASILALANHEHIVRFHGVSCWSNYFAIIMDYEVNGSLHFLLKSATVLEIPWNLRLRMVFETVKALKFLHNSGLDDRVVHGDLKSSNILLSEDLRIRVADFGAAVLATKTIDQSHVTPDPHSRVHTVVFSAPEFLRDVFAVRAKSMDMFSLGRVIYEVVTRLTPFQDHNHENITDSIIHGLTPDVSTIPRLRNDLIIKADENLIIFDLLVKLMNECSNPNEPHRRPKIEEVYDQIGEQMKEVSPISLNRSVSVVLNQMHIRLKQSTPQERIPLQSLLNNV